MWNHQFGAMPNDEIRAVAEWLIDGARSAPLPQQVLAQLCDQLVACGIPLWRVAVFVRTLHPNIMGRRLVWRRGAEVEVREAPFELLESSDFLDSTIARVYLTADPIRRRLAVPDPVLDFPILAELRAEGVTDYFATPLVFTDGIIHVATWTTREPRGFTDEQIAGIEAIVTPLARVAEVRALRRTASTLREPADFFNKIRRKRPSAALRPNRQGRSKPPLARETLAGREP